MAVGELFLSAFLQVLFDRLAPRARDLWNLVRREGLEKKLEQLEKTFRTIEEVLADAEEKQLTDRAVKLWLDDLRDWAYDAEDVLDEFAIEALRQKVIAKRQASTSKLPNLVSACFTPTASKFNVKMGPKIEAITSQLEEISKRKEQFGLVKTIGGASKSTNAWQPMPTTSLPTEPAVCGRDEDKENIIDLLRKDEAGDFNFHVISIVGMGGLGKTTLARHVYNDEAVLLDFHTKAWVCVSNKFDVVRITKEILEAVTSQSCDLKGLDLIQGKLRESLAQKKFLIVLDDVWDTEYAKWESLRSVLRFGAPGSKIIVTTREKDVALMMKSVKPYELKLLSDDDCWFVFKKHAFENEDTATYPNLGLLHKKVVERCKGLPLAARTLGGILCYKPMNEWDYILNSKIWSLSEVESDIFKTLKLSYHCLSSELKRCFAYCAIFPQDYEFTEKELVHLWTGEGFIQQLEENKNTNEIGARYFRELVSRSIFQASSNHNSKFVMHDLVHELAQWASGETCFRLEDVSDERHKRIQRARHSSYGSTTYGIKRYEVFHEVKCLRTFLPLPQPYYGTCLTYSVLFDLLPKLKKLRVLSFAKYNIAELPDSIGDLKHLRYLNLSCTKIRVLPESTCSLYNLQSLILSYCGRLRKLPSKMENLVNLCHLDITDTLSLEAMPIGLKELKSLQTLSDFVLGNDNGCKIKELMNFKRLYGRMCISKLENVVDVKDAEEANLNEKSLDVVELRWSYNFDDSRNVETEKHVLGVLEPQQNLKELRIQCYSGSGFPTWLGDSSFFSIGLLELINCKNCTCLPPVGKLSSLKKLVISGMPGVQTVGAEFFGSSYSKPFPLLEALYMEDMPEWENWSGFEVNEQLEVFPRLRELSIIRCPKLLGNLPDNLVSLEKLAIHECGKLSASISGFSKLCKLGISGCQQIMYGITIELTKVERLWIGGDGFPELIRINLPCTVKHLHLPDFGRLERLPMTFCSLSHLRKLDISDCSSLVSLPSAVLSSTVLDYVRIIRCKNLQSLVDDGQEDVNLGCSSTSTIKQFKIAISDCPSLEFVAKVLPNSLTQLEIYACSRLKFIAKTFLDNTRLEEIEITNCETFQSFQEGLHKLSHLNRLKLHNCPNFISFPEEGLPCLQELDICNCPGVVFVPVEGLLSNLTSLSVSDVNICRTLVEWGLHRLSTLKTLTISSGCPEVEAMGMTLPTSLPLSLTELMIWNCPGVVFVPVEGFLSNLTSLSVSGVNICWPLVEWGLHRLSSLKTFTISSGCPEAEVIGMTLLTSLPLSLMELTIEDFPNLKSLSSNCFRNLTSLEVLVFKNCPKLKCLPKEGLPPSLLVLRINQCPLLKIRCKRDKGKDWSKIAYIPSVNIDWESPWLLA